ncbi:MAG: hypothetical protein ACYDEJ_12980 [Desulfitobacteriaceae bacterium]
MEDKKCFLIIRDKYFYFMTNEDSSIYHFNFDTLESIPGTYCFLNLFDKLRMNAKALKGSMIKITFLISPKYLEKII